MKIKRNQKGFTLIEVVLVLAIGGLIFLLAFLAFQQVSRNRRDTQRRADSNKLLAELQNYASDNNGTFPTGTIWADGWSLGQTPNNDTKRFFNNYMGGEAFKDPKGNTYTVVAVSGATTINGTLLPLMNNQTPDDRGKILVLALNSICNGNPVQVADSTSNIAVVMGLESGLSCRDTR